MSPAARWARWRPALRMARRDVRAHKARSTIVTLLVALPIAAAVTISTVAATTSYYSSNSLYESHGSADVALEVTPWPSVRTSFEDEGRYVLWRQTRGLTKDDRRRPLAVDVTPLLPSGSTTTLTGYVTVPLTTGGTLYGQVLDLDSDLTRGLGGLAAGRAPSAPDEVAVFELVADELGLTGPDGSLRTDAVLPLRGDAGDLRVVGLAETTTSYDDIVVVVPPESRLVGTGIGDDLRGDIDSVTYLVDLPAMTRDELQALESSLAAAGVSTWVRDAALHPDAWDLDRPIASPVDGTAVAVGALVIGLGLVEVLVLVGSAFAVGARRQSRTLGLLISSGGTPADVRRTVLAQGLCIGAIATLTGLLLGAGALIAGRDVWGRVVDARLFDYDVSPGGVVAIAVLGFASAVLAAAIPAWGVGRMTASQALDGHIALQQRRTGQGPSRLRAPALAMVSLGLLGVLACGFWIARTWAGDPIAPSSLPVALAALNALVLLVGTALGLPLLVTWSSRFTSRGWLPWRLATRDASRNRGRTTAAVLAIGIVTAGAVFAGFGVSAANAYADPDGTSSQELPPDAAEIYLSPREAKDPQILASLTRTVTDVLGADAVTMSSAATKDGKRVVDRGRSQAQVVDDAWLEIQGVPEGARSAFAEGAAVVTQSGLVRNGEVELRTPGRSGATLASVPAVEVDLGRDTFRTWMPASTAEELDLVLRPTGTLLAHADDLDQAGVDRLSIYGIFAQVEYDGAPSPLLVYAGAAGTLALTALVVGMIVALSASEGRSDAATLAAVGAPPWTRRAMSAAHATYVGGLGSGVGLLLGAAVGATTLQVVGTSGTPVPWGGLAILVVGVPVLCAAVGWAVTPTRLALTRRAG